MITWEIIYLAFQVLVVISTSLKAEIIAIYNCLMKALDGGFRSIICESDSHIALDLIYAERDKFISSSLLIDNVDQRSHS